MAEHETTDQQPIVSVIISTYNRAQFIARAIESVLAQSYPHFELIIIDDGSTDGTAEVVARYQDSRIRYQWVENGERSRARNLGIHLSHGRYIAFLDSDDWFLPDKLAHQVAVIEADPAIGMVLGGWRIVDENGRKIKDVCPWDGVTLQPTAEDWLFAVTVTPITILVRREYLEQIQGFDITLSYSEDIDLCIRLVLAGCQIAWLREMVAVVLVHSNNSLRDWPKVKRGRLAFLERLFDNAAFVEKLTISRQEVFAAFHLTLAWEAYDAQLVEEAKQELMVAVELNPGLRQNHYQAIIQGIVNYSQYFLVADPIAFVRRVFDNLPAALPALRRYRRWALGTTWMSLSWRLHEAGEVAPVRQSVLRAIWYTPGCLRNRGILSMLFQSLVGPCAWVAVRPMLRRVTQ
jgi:glycosyltransferase involved in cell wall biosynthesis